MKKTLKNLLTAITFGLAVLPPIEKVEAQVTGSIEYIHSEIENKSYPRILAFYGLPLETSGFTFMEFYNGDRGYFGKTYLDKPIFGRAGLRAELDHIREPFSQTGFGPSVTIPGLPEGAFARVSILPAWFGNSGKAFGEKTMLQYSFRLPLPLGFGLGGFGDINLSGENGAQYTYGELDLTKDVGSFKVGYNPSLLNDGGIVPKLEHRLNIGVRF